jgi:hypothetical protein
MRRKNMITIKLNKHIDTIYHKYMRDGGLRDLDKCHEICDQLMPTSISLEDNHDLLIRAYQGDNDAIDKALMHLDVVDQVCAEVGYDMYSEEREIELLRDRG